MPPTSPFEHVTFTDSAVNFTPGPSNWLTLQPTDPEVNARRAQLQKHVAILQTMGIKDLSELSPMHLASNVLLPKGLVCLRAASSAKVKANPSKQVIFSYASQRDPRSGQFIKMSGVATQLAYEPLSIPSAKNTTDLVYDKAYWAAEWINLADGTNVILAEPNTHLVILAKKLTVGANVTFTYERSLVSQPAKRPKPGKPVTPNKPGGFSDGKRGTDGTTGDAGNMGASFEPAPTIEIWTLELNGSPAVDLRGQDGGQGGSGGDGGDGGDGGPGTDGHGTSSGPGNGGDGGNGGKAGDGGPGGNGGWGGQFTLYAPQPVLTAFSSAGFFISVDGGAAGQGGMPGVPGNGGNGGPRGSYSSFQSSSMGRHGGSSGHQGAAGKQGPTGNAGHQSVSNPTKLIAITPDEFTTALAKPAIISFSVPISRPKGCAQEGDSITIDQGKNFNPTDVVQMIDDISGNVIPCQTVVSGDTLASFKVPKVPGGKRSFYILQADGTKSNQDSVKVLPTLDHIEPGPRVKPGATIKIHGTGFSKEMRLKVIGKDSIPQDATAPEGITYLDPHTIQGRIIRPRAGMPDDAAGEHVTLLVELPDLTPSNTIPIVLDTYRVFVFGDSVAWGCGLGDSDKFSTLVMNEVATRNGGGIGLYKTVAAHTGAIIGVGNSDSGPELNSEVPNSFPTILEQVNKWKSIPDAKDVDLVLVDGGINDVGISTILNIHDKPNLLQDATQQHCYKDMKTLLAAITSAFSTARIVVTGYFPILSSGSEQTMGHQFLSAVILLFLKFPDPRIVPTNPAEWLALFLQCDVFARTANSALAKAVSETNSALGGPARIFFADPGFGPDNAVFAKDACLFGVRGDFSPEDGMASERSKVCGAEAFCKHASLGHPNAKGAAKYAQAISAFL
jgi:hypothetical protein